MFLPRERIVLDGLSPDLLRMEAFIKDLSSRRHKGYVLFRGEEDFVALFSYGKFLGYYDKNGFTKKTEDAIGQARSIDVVALSDTVFSIFMYILFGKKRYALKGEFTDIRRLLQDLEKEGFSGVVEVVGNKVPSIEASEGDGYILMEEGIPQDSFIFSEGRIRREEALRDIIRISQENSLINVYGSWEDNTRHIILLQRKTRYIYEKMRPMLGAGFHSFVERRLKEVREKHTPLQDVSITKEGMLRLPFVEEREFLREEEISSSFDDFVSFLLSCVSDVAGDATTVTLKREIELL